MVWVLIITIISVILANMPLMYVLLKVHHTNGISQLWGYAPNQFLFPLLAFPIAAFATFLATKLLLTTLQELAPPHPVVKWVATNWIVIGLIIIILTALICIVDYWGSAKTFDKLHPVYAKKAVSSAKETRQLILDLPKETREEERKKLIKNWRREKTDFVDRNINKSNIKEELLKLDAGVYLQIVQDPRLQRRFQLMNQTLHALNVVQVFVTLFAGISMLVATILCIYVFRVCPEL